MIRQSAWWILGPVPNLMMIALSPEVGWRGRWAEVVRGVDYYELLGVQRTASAAEIKSAYRALAKTLHPDVGGTAGTFRLIREAYEILADPVRRADYDGVSPAQPASQPSPEPRPRRRPGGTGLNRPFGEDPNYTPRVPRVYPDDLPWWDVVDPAARTRYVPVTGPATVPMLGMLGGWFALLLAGLTVQLPSVPMVLWLVLVAGSGVVVLALLRQAFVALRRDRLFKAEFGRCAVFGQPDPDEPAARVTGDLLRLYFTRMPGARMFHGLSWPESVFADIDHAVLCGHRLVLIESKRWLPGHYTADTTGTLWRNGHHFRGGTTRLSEGVAAYQELLPGLEVRGVLLLYPSRDGLITTGDSETSTPPLTPEQFIRDIGAWLSAEPATVDRDAFRTVLAHVVAG